MRLVIDLADRSAIRETYRDCRKWRSKGGVLRLATPPSYKFFNPTLLIPRRRWHRLLELGCGLEKWMGDVIELSAPDAALCAYDMSQDVLRVFSQEFGIAAQERRFELICVKGDGEALPFPDSYFDGISAVFVGHHMKNAESFVRGLSRVLKPDGWVLTNSVDWSFPPPDFPSQAVQNLSGQNCSFEVKNAFERSLARNALDKYFFHVQEQDATIPAELQFTEQLMRLHSRLEEFIKPVLLHQFNREWAEYMHSFETVVKDFLDRSPTFRCDLPITYFLAQYPRVLPTARRADR